MCRVHTKPAMRLVPAMSSSMRCSGVAASRSPGSASSIALRRYVPPCAPTRPSMPGRGGVDSIEVIRRSMSTTACIAASSTTTASPVRVVTRSRAPSHEVERRADAVGPHHVEARRAARRSGAPSGSAASASRRAVRAAGGARPRRCRSPGHPTEDCRERLPAVDEVRSRAWTTSSARTNARAPRASTLLPRRHP